MSAITDPTRLLSTKIVPVPFDHRAIDMTGKVFGRLTVLGYSGRVKSGLRTWLCTCTCGTQLDAVIGGNLRRGLTKSCGCLHSDLTTQRNTTHGQSHSAIYRTWAKIVDRCKNPKCRTYSSYGGRGIGIADEWLNFENFQADIKKIGEKPSKSHTIDRKDNEIGYVPGNLRWATKKEQARNRRNNRLFTFYGKTQCLSAWAEELNIPVKTLDMRVRRNAKKGEPNTVHILNNHKKERQVR